MEGGPKKSGKGKQKAGSSGGSTGSKLSNSSVYHEDEPIDMTEEIDKHVLRKYHVCQKLGKGVNLETVSICRINFVSLFEHET